MLTNDPLANLATKLENRARVLSHTRSEEIVPLKIFLYDDGYLALPPLSNIQENVIAAATNILHPPMHTEICVEAGKGSGKDFISRISLAYIIYQLLCLDNPYQTLVHNAAPDEYIDAMNVAINAPQANRVFFQPFVQMINRAPIFRKLGFDDHKGLVEFPKRIRAISGHSDQEGLEGYNLIFAVLDEISAFKTDEELENASVRSTGAMGLYYAMLATTQSRFPGIGKVVALSWPRFKNDAIQQLTRTEARKHDPTIYIVGPYPTWIVNPTKTQDDFKDEYRKNPVNAKARYECDPPESEEPYFRNISTLENLFGNESLPEIDSYEFAESTKPDPESNYCLHVDLALKRDQAGFSMSHMLDHENVQIDFVDALAAVPGRDIEFETIRQIIFDLRDRGFRIKKVTLDGWQSIDMIQTLNRHKIEAEVLSVDRNTEVYDTFQTMLYSERVKCEFRDPKLLRELKGLQLIRGKKIDHKPGGSKDKADSAAGSVYNALQFPKEAKYRDLGSIGDMVKVGDKTGAKQENPEIPTYKIEKDKCPICGKINWLVVKNGRQYCEFCGCWLDN